jgi:hypothetical protein
MKRKAQAILCVLPGIFTKYVGKSARETVALDLKRQFNKTKNKTAGKSCRLSGKSIIYTCVYERPRISFFF